MKKSEVIAYLNNIKGDPDVVFYNSDVSDYQHISLTKANLYKATIKDEYAALTLEKRVEVKRLLTFTERYALYKRAKKHFRERDYKFGRNFYKHSLKPIPLVTINNLERGKTTLNGRWETVHY